MLLTLEDSLIVDISVYNAIAPEIGLRCWDIWHITGTLAQAVTLLPHLHTRVSPSIYTFLRSSIRMDLCYPTFFTPGLYWSLSRQTVGSIGVHNALCPSVLFIMVLHFVLCVTKKEFSIRLESHRFFLSFNVFTSTTRTESKNELIVIELINTFAWSENSG